MRLGQQADLSGLKAKEKVLGAHRAGVRTVILPRENQGDLEEVPVEVRSNMIFAPVDRIEQVLQLALETAPLRRDGVEPKTEPPAARESAGVPKPVGVAARRG